jgi:hypothetical protein
MSTRRSATLGSPEPVWPIGTWCSIAGLSPSAASSSATTWLRVSASRWFATGEPVALARASMRT